MRSYRTLIIVPAGAFHDAIHIRIFAIPARPFTRFALNSTVNLRLLFFSISGNLRLLI
jgi:hypothetical protein